MKNTIKFFLCIIFLQSSLSFSMDFVNTVKGIGGTLEGWGKDFVSKSFWQKLGMGFGASPTGYIYSFTVCNDVQEPLYVGIQEMASAMGATFPKADGSHSYEVGPLQQYVQRNKSYYFEMTINPPTDRPHYHFPYSSSGSLYVQDCIQLPKEKHSPLMNYFRTYVGKVLKDGRYQHELQAEYVGSANPTSKNKKEQLSMVPDITTLVIHNSTVDDWIVGYSSQRLLSKATKQDCDVFLAPVVKDSFGIFKPSKADPLTVGTVCLFAKDSDKAVELWSFPQKVFKGKTYTIEIYQDQGQKVRFGMQGIMPGHYDIAMGRVRDITPQTGIIWYESTGQLTKQNSSLVDLPGEIWMVLQDSEQELTHQVELGTTLEFRFFRPAPGSKLQIYFVYVASKDKQKVGQFIDRFLQKKIGQEAVQAFTDQSKKQVDLAKEKLTQIIDVQAGSAIKSGVSQELLIEAVQGALKIHQGKITDTSTGVDGYLVGVDFFTSQGVSGILGNTPFYYQMSPSFSSSAPTSSVKNIYAYSFSASQAPKGMPEPSKVIGIPKQKVPVVKKLKSRQPVVKNNKKVGLRSRLQNLILRNKKEG